MFRFSLCLDSLSYTISFFGLNRYALQNFFQNFFQAPQTALNGDPHDFLMDAFCPGNILFGHAENEMGVNTFRLFIRQPGNSGMKFLHSHFALIQIMRRKCNEKSLMLNTVIPVKGVVRLVPVCTQTVSCLFAVELGKQIGHFVSYFNKTILCIMRVNIPQIDNFHKYLRFGCSG